MEIPDDIRDRVALAPHYYPPMVHEPGEGYDGDAAAIESALLHVYSLFLDAGTPVWIGEYGGITTNPAFDDYFADLSAILFGHFLGSALWEYSAGATSFSLLEATGEPRAVFTSSARVPVPTLLPSPPAEIAPDPDAGSLSASFECVVGRQVEVLLPEEGPDGCTASPATTHEPDPPADGAYTARCVDDGQVALACP
jgi:hypothetical protein